VLGPRPTGPGARGWDDTAGRLAQHQAAFDVTGGLGHTPRYVENSAYADSHHAITARLTDGHLIEQRAQEVEDLALDL
jgi:hypothetical protein